MIEIGIYEAKTKLAELLKQVEKGEFITITNRGIPVADLLPSASRVAQQTSDAIAAIKTLRKPDSINQTQFDEIKSEAVDE